MDKAQQILSKYKGSEELKMVANYLGLATQPVTNITESEKAPQQVWKQFGPDGHADPNQSDWFARLYDLLHSLDEVSEMLDYEIARYSWLNAYLLAAGMNQITEDFLSADTILFEKAIKLLQGMHGPLSKLLIEANRLVIFALVQLNQWRLSTQMVVRWQKKLTNVVSKLADSVMAGDREAGVDTSLVDDVNEVIYYVSRLPIKLRKQIIKLPSCFLSFDQQPEDIQRIAIDFSSHWRDPDRQIDVIGIRTSGNYLAPLYASVLRSSGYQHVRAYTIRPGKTLSRGERLAIKELKRSGGLALVCDDPPISGNTLVKAGQIIERFGIPSRNVVLLLQLFGDPNHLPAKLHKYPAVLMPWLNWNIHRQLEVEAVEHVLSELCLPTLTISRLQCIPNSDPKDNREHARAVYQVDLINLQNNEITSHLVQVKGIGLGYYGEHAIAISEQLADYAPRNITVKPGLVYREMPTGSNSLSSSTVKKDRIPELVKYIVERNQKLSARNDTSLSLFGRNAAWEVASNMLGRAFGRGWFAARMPLIDPFVKQVLHADRPSIIDGDMSMEDWYCQESFEFNLMKLDVAERDFSHLDLYSYDPVYDLAGLAGEIDDAIEPVTIKKCYENLSGDEITPERWMLYRLVHLWDMQRHNLWTEGSINNKQARITQEYFSELYFKDIKTNQTRPLCAFDVDGVLEGNQLGFPSLTRSSATSLRALLMHGYRVILATGRSLGELKERSAAYHLTGGVAEYGAVIYDSCSGQSIQLLTNEEQVMLSALRKMAVTLPGVYLDGNYTFVVRAFRLDKDGNRIRLTAEMIDRLTNDPEFSDQIYAIQGKSQTDFMVKRIDKGLGIKEWITHFDTAPEHPNDRTYEYRPLVFAMGDSRSDLPLFALAERSFIPAHSKLVARTEGIQQTSRPYQRGMYQAVTTFIGHKPGSCPVCRQADISSQTIHMLDLLSIQENGTINMVWEAIKLLQRIVRKSHVRTE